ncbi:MAG: hypothetical protein JWM30_1837 [Burkholderia sp.]|jgi:hypothetical protein|nr:hypothetical protein [Burkholderia sp.]
MDPRNTPFRKRLQGRVRQFWRLAMPFWLFRDAHHGTTEQRIANYRFNRAQRNILPFYMAKWLGISVCLLKMTELLSGLMLSTQSQTDDHLFAALSCMSAGIAFAFSCIVLLMLATSYLYLSCVER